jgi:hypothetical protein
VPDDPSSVWTLDTFKVLIDERVAHMAALHDADLQFQEERDRRYAEVAVEREKALNIKEVADLTALNLASENQHLRDEAHNGLLAQWQEDRGKTVTVERFDATIKPLSEWMQSQQGIRTNTLDSRALLFAVLGFLLAAGIVISNVVH